MSTNGSLPHTPGEWKIYERSGKPYKMTQCRATIFTPGDILVAETYTAADAEYIVACVNSHAALVAARTNLTEAIRATIQSLNAVLMHPEPETIVHDWLSSTVKLLKQIVDSDAALANQETPRQAPDYQPLIAAAENFVNKVESGRARSTKSYSEFKAALALAGSAGAGEHHDVQ